MLRLTAIESLLCLLALSGVQAVERCGIKGRNQCVPHHLCDIGYEDNRGTIEDYVDLRSNNRCMPTKTCCPTNKILTDDQDNPWDNPPEQTDCGIVNKRGKMSTLRSPKGFAQENELTWMVALLHTNDTYLGGGSLIALDVVLTACHKTQNLDNDEIVVRAGEWDLENDSERFPHVDVGVRKIVCFPNFERRTGANNLALLFVKKPFELSHRIRPICLPSRNKKFNRKRCIFSGWGKDAVRQNRFMNIMKKVDLPIVSRRSCEAELKKHRGPYFLLHDSLMCAGGEDGKDSCKGDGGSPLACPLEDDPNRFEQAGIVNWGVGCGEENIPAVYTDVAKFRGWIDQQIGMFSRVNYKPSRGHTTPESEEYDDPTTLPPPSCDDYENNQETTPIRPHETDKYSSDEINAEDYIITVTTTMRPEEEPRPMQVIKS